jgi:uncharacterized protein (UPF0332 family)
MMIDTAEPEDAEFWHNVIQNTLELWVEPEINRRLSAGEIDTSWRMFGAQVVMNVGKPAEVRLNGEVRAVFKGRLPGATPNDTGKTISLDDLETIEEAHLTTDDDDAGHITLLVHRGRWFVSFDFRYNRRLILEYFRVADEFLSTARDALTHDRLGAFVENLFAGVEHGARCYLLQAPEEDVIKPDTSHKFVQTNFNRRGTYGDIERCYVELLNTLWNMRRSARYMTAEFSLSASDARAFLATADDMRVDIEERLPVRMTPPRSD